MEFLVHIVIDPAGLAGPEGSDRLTTERKHAVELVRNGILTQMWKIPGANANWAVFDVEDATALHEVLTALPMWGYLTCQVHPLAQHPIKKLIQET